MNMERMIEMIIAMTLAMLLVTLMLMLDKQMKKHNNNNKAQKEALMSGRGRRCFYVRGLFMLPSPYTLLDHLPLCPH